MLAYLLVLSLTFLLIASCSTVPTFPVATRNPLPAVPRYVLVTNPPPPVPPGLPESAPTVTRRLVLSSPSVAVPVSRLRTNSYAIYVPPNGRLDVRREWQLFQMSTNLRDWRTVTSNEQLSGYYTTNNVVTSNVPNAFFRTVSQN